MARIRTIKPEFYTDEAILSVSRDARLMLIGMFNFADDEGRMDDSPIQIKARVFPGDMDLGAVQIQGLLTELANARIINRYSCEKNHNYIEIKNFRKHQKIDRPNPSTIPPPSRVIDEYSPKDRDQSPPEGKGREGNVREGNNIVTSKEVTRDILPNVTTPEIQKKEEKAKAEFEVWWKYYPSRRKIGKPKCYQKWLQLRRDKKLLPLEQMIAVLTRQKHSKDWLKDGGDFIPGPHPYLNQMRFMDESLDSGSGLAPRPVFTPAPPQLTPENVHEYADPECPECQGKGMFLKEAKGIKVRVRCECADKKFNEMTGGQV